MLVVAAIDGNALLQRGQPLPAAAQCRNVKTAASVLAEIARAWQNGPQVAQFALQGAA
ncbi:MAG: carbamate kinase [Paracoccaceae bacterium]|jgi:carbamate kinase